MSVTRETSQPSRSLVKEVHKGTLVDYLDYAEKCYETHLMHTFNRLVQKEAALTFQRTVRPGIVYRDLDFGENYKMFEAREVSGHRVLGHGPPVLIGVHCVKIVAH